MKTKILRTTAFSLSAIVALAITAHAQNLYVSNNNSPGNNDGVIYEYTPSGVQSTYASGLRLPRGLGFDSIGNLFAAETRVVDHGLEIGRVLKFNPRNKVSVAGTAANFFCRGLAIDSAGNAFVIALDLRSDPPISTIFKFTPSGDRTVFGSVPGEGWDLAFDSAGTLYASAGDAQTIYKFAPNGTRTVFVGPSAFPEGVLPIGLAFDGSGNLFVSTECFCDSGNDTIVKFTPTGVESIFATGLSYPRGLAFDGSGSLFVVENLSYPDGDILKITPGGGTTVFASGLRLPNFVTFGPPR